MGELVNHLNPKNRRGRANNSSTNSNTPEGTGQSDVASPNAFYHKHLIFLCFDAALGGQNRG
jgi:hypothetical protein